CEEMERRAAELAALADAYARALEEHREMTDACELLKHRNHELTIMQERDQADFRSTLDTEHAKQHALAEELREVCARSEENARRLEELVAAQIKPTETILDPNPELETASAEIETLKRRLAQSEFVNRDMAAVLNGMGVRFTIPGPG